MKRKLLIFTLLLTMIMSFNVFGTETVTNNVSQTETSIVTPNFVANVYREVSRTYVNEISIPGSIYYQEYISGNWFSGTLYLNSYYRNSAGNYVATFTGYIQGQL